MKTEVILGFLFWTALGSIAIWCSGCAGVEVGGKFGLYRVDERADSSATVQAQTKPLKCYIVDCSNEVAHGS